MLGGATSPPPSVEISVTGLRNLDGQILVCLTANPKAFPDCSEDAGAVRIAVKAADAADFTIPAPAPGTYAVALVHDENSNNKMDMALFIPEEGFGFSRNPAVFAGPPRFKSARFVVTGQTAQSIEMKYML